jgi:hypothetical protein
MDTPDVTPTQYGAGGVFLAVALACLAQSVTGTDLIAYLGSASIVTAALVIADARIRNGRAGTVAAEYQGFQANATLFGAKDEVGE